MRHLINTVKGVKVTKNNAGHSNTVLEFLQSQCDEDAKSAFCGIQELRLIFKKPVKQCQDLYVNNFSSNTNIFCKHNVRNVSARTAYQTKRANLRTQQANTQALLANIPSFAHNEVLTITELVSELFFPPYCLLC